MRLAIFLPSLRGGGAERVMLLLAGGFAKKGYTVDLILAQRVGPYLSEIPKNVNVVDLKAKRVLMSLPGLVRYLRSAQPIALLSAMDHANVIALWAKKLACVNVRVVVSVHNPITNQIAHSKGRARLISYFARWCYDWADDIVAVSQGVANDLGDAIGLPIDRIRVIYNPVVVPELFKLAKEGVVHPWFRVGDPPVILSAGRLNIQKDYPTLLQAFSLVLRKRPVRLVILGEGEERGELESMVRDLALDNVVSLPGFVKNPYAYMAKASVFVLSSIWEGFGNVLVEAMALGTTVVATDCKSGPSEILEEGCWGQLVPVGDAEALAAAITAVLCDPSPPDVARRAMSFGADLAVTRYLAAMGLEP